jgi:hypothetical protein
MSDSPGIHVYNAKGFLNKMQEKIIFWTITVKNVNEGSPSPAGNPCGVTC